MFTLILLTMLILIFILSRVDQPADSVGFLLLGLVIGAAIIWPFSMFELGIYTSTLFDFFFGAQP